VTLTASRRHRETLLGQQTSVVSPL